MKLNEYKVYFSCGIEEVFYAENITQATISAYYWITNYRKGNSHYIDKVVEDNKQEYLPSLVFKIPQKITI